MVQKIKFNNSTIQILTDDLCKTFPNLSELYLIKVSLEYIEPRAFDQCKQLIYLNIWMNNFSRLHEDVFDQNQKLVELNLQNNGLQVIQGKIFDSLHHLSFLNLAENFLTKFPVQEFPVMDQLEYLFLHSNNLTDLDERELKNKFPNLKSININNNLFDCDRLKTIVESLKRSEVKLLTWYEQIYQIYNVEDIMCLTKEQGNEELESKMNWMVLILISTTFLLIILFVYKDKVLDQCTSIMGTMRLRRRIERIENDNSSNEDENELLPL